VNAAAKAIGRDSRGIYQNLQGNAKSAYRFSWKYKNPESTSTWPSTPATPGTQPFARPILQLCPDTGKVIKEYKSIYAAAKSLGINKSNLRNCLRNEGRKASGYCWKFKHGKETAPETTSVLRTAKPVVQFCPKTDRRIAEYSSVKEAGIVLGIETTCIYRNIRKQSHSAHGFVWRWKEDPPKNKRPESMMDDDVNGSDHKTQSVTKPKTMVSV